MCCSRVHYPFETGLWETDDTGSHHHEIKGKCDKSDLYEFRHHLHILLPERERFLGTACSFLASVLSVQAVWNNWIINPNGHFSPRVYLNLPGEYALDPSPEVKKKNYPFLTKVRDIWAIAIAESGLPTIEKMEEIAREISVREGFEASLTHDNSHIAERFKEKAEVPEYHEWLVMQAQAEARNKRRENGIRSRGR